MIAVRAKAPLCRADLIKITGELTLQEGLAVWTDYVEYAFVIERTKAQRAPLSRRGLAIERSVI
ncbi:hypothetical protein NBRC116587_31220 [Pseudoteredinibacter isoporae]